MPQPRDVDSSPCSPTPQFWDFVLVVLLDAHKKPPLPIPKETDLTPRAIFLPPLQFLPLRMPMFHSGGASGGCPSLTPMETKPPSPCCSVAKMQNTLWGRFLQCLQLVECSPARVVPSWCQSMFPMNVTLLMNEGPCHFDIIPRQRQTSFTLTLFPWKAFNFWRTCHGLSSISAHRCVPRGSALPGLLSKTFCPSVPSWLWIWDPGLEAPSPSFGEH